MAIVQTTKSGREMLMDDFHSTDIASHPTHSGASKQGPTTLRMFYDTNPDG